jgi:hypothetical protein
MDTHLEEHVSRWAAAHPLEPAHVDCATAVMLKILDGKCKMPDDEKPLMAALYRAVKHRPGLRLAPEVHARIAALPPLLDDAAREQVYGERVLAETMISRPVMKAFKGMLRAEGLLPRRPSADHAG